METQNMAEAISEKMCRMCLCQCDVKNSVDIFYANDLSIRIMACAGLEVRLIFHRFIFKFLNLNIYLKIFVRLPNKTPCLNEYV